MNYVGDFAADETVYLNFASYDSNGASVTLTGLATSDIEIYKNGGTTQRSSDAGYTVSTDFDTITGIHAISIDTSDNTDAGFFAAGNDYVVIVSSVTIDSQTVSFVAGSFSIENRFMRGTDSAALATDLATVDTNVDAILVDTGTSLPADIAALNNLSAAQVNAEVDTAIADAALATAASLATVDANVDAILVDTGTTIPAQISGLNDISAAQVNAEVDTALADYDGPTKAELDAGLAALNDPTAAAIADAVLDEALSGHTTAGTLGKAVADVEADTNELQSDDVPGLIAGLNDLSAAQVNAEVDTAISEAALATAASLATVDTNVDAILVDTGTTIPAQITGLNDLSAADVNAEVDTALADIHLDHLLAVDYDPATPPGTSTALLNELIESDAGVSRFTVNALENAPSGSGASAESIADAVWDESLSGHTTAGSAGKAVADIETDATAVLEDTGTTIPALIAALNDLSAAQVNAEVDAAIGDAALATAANLATVDGIVDAILVDTATTIPGLIAALNDLSAAQVNAEVDTALADYDAPTKAELDAGLAALNDPTAAAIADAVLDEATAGHTTPGTVGALLADVLADTNELQADDVPGLIAALNDISIGDILQTQLTESYAADGVAPTLTQAVMLIQQILTELNISGLTGTIKKLDGSTTAATLTYDADPATSVTRSG